MEVVDIHAPALKALAPRLEALMKQAQSDEERDPLDYLLGALHGLFLAKLEFKDRSHPLHDDRGRSSKGVPYWDYGPLARVGLMTKGQLRIDGAWAGGFFFNSALVRMAAVFDRAVRRKAIQAGLDVDPRPVGSGPPPRVWHLLHKLGLRRFTSGKLADVYEEANPLKHSPAGLAKRRKITMADATTAFAQLLDLLEHPKMR